MMSEELLYSTGIEEEEEEEEEDENDWYGSSHEQIRADSLADSNRCFVNGDEAARNNASGRLPVILSYSILTIVVDNAARLSAKTLSQMTNLVCSMASRTEHTYESAFWPPFLLPF
ncbi:hypothetical protein V1477_010832 [Vespula maculifrons]|uniref:Uncharacterized protein n=1 Tax=Vespula maculifrons TaxID=7453 RepID=A0ABD2C4W8_VESMC